MRLVPLLLASIVGAPAVATLLGKQSHTPIVRNKISCHWMFDAQGELRMACHSRVIPAPIEFDEKTLFEDVFERSSASTRPKEAALPRPPRPQVQ